MYFLYSLVAMFKQSENVTIVHVHLVAMRGVASATTFICACSRYYGGQSCPGRILFVHELRLYICEHVLLIDDHTLSHDCDLV